MTDSTCLSAAGAVPLPKSRLPAEHHREDKQPVLVDQVVLQQRLQQVGTAPALQAPAGLLPELPKFGNHVALEQAGVVPGDTLEAARHHVLWPRVERGRDGVIRVGDLGPVTGEDVIGLAPEQETVGVRDSLDDQPPHDIFDIGGLPASMQEATLWILVGAAGSLHDAVQGQKCIHDDLRHTLVLHQSDEPHRPESTGWGAPVQRNFCLEDEL